MCGPQVGDSTVSIANETALLQQERQPDTSTQDFPPLDYGQAVYAVLRGIR